MQCLRQSEIVEGEVGLTELQRQNWHHFVEKMYVICEDENFDLNEDTDLGNDLILREKFENVYKNIQQWKQYSRCIPTRVFVEYI